MKSLIPVLLLLLFSARLGRAEDSENGFRRIFNGTSLTDWDGDPRFWSAKDGVLRGETTFSQPAFTSSFLIWRAGTVKDFELHLKFRLLNGTSGIQYRGKDLGNWSVVGYQAQIDNLLGKTGFLYDDQRKALVGLSQVLQTNPQGGKHVLYTLATKEQYQEWGYYRPKDWNEYIIAAKGTWIGHWVNGYQTVLLIDDDRAQNSLEGVLAFELHAGLPMTIEFKDILLKSL